ncbi:VPA1269 family protein [Microvirga pakistanensis]|uniref:VPA1269 family protein n=1 Tax=Microvirga pakistanensis TaxID=1682650 RepID=UPI00106D81D9|nr:VPA1269 family protein [Microvirga pakistanensis]
MSEFIHSIAASTQVAGEWFNIHPEKFALVPNEDGTIDDEIGHLVDDLVEQYTTVRERNGGSSNALGELLELHAAGLILWPIAFLWDQSGLGKMHEKRFNRIAAEYNEDLVAMQVEIQELESFKRAVPRDGGGRDFRARSFAYWKIAASIALSSTNVTSIDDLKSDHFDYIASVFMPEGEWADWAAGWTRKTFRWFVDILGKERQDPNLGRSLLANPLKQLRRSTRNISIVASKPHLSWIDTEYERFLDEGRYLQKRAPRYGKNLLLDYFGQLSTEAGSSPEKAFSRSNMLGLLTYVKIWSTAPKQQLFVIGKVRDFAQWMVEESRDENGYPTLHTGITDKDVEKLAREMPPQGGTSKHTDVAARPMPTKYHLALKQLIKEDDFAWPKSLVDGKTGRPLHWCTYTKPDSSTGLVFCEVLPRLLLLLLDLPLRTVQARRLDSGEGDARTWQPGKGWSASINANANYWERMGARNPTRGVFREITSRNGAITGFWINSNKTADAATRFDETSGYLISWQLDEQLENLFEMRKWQETYNPVSAPLEFDDIPSGIFEDDPSESLKHLIPARFFLFRYPQNSGARGKEAPPTYKVLLQFFYDALDELERRLNKEDPENKICLITQRDKSGAPKKAIFNMHGMRSATLTALYEEGVSVEVLSKIVAGHASILMTLKYLKFDPAHVSQILTDARRKALTKARSEFPNFLRNATYEQAARMTARLSDDGLHQLYGKFSEPSAWLQTDCGICPNGGTLCNIGGKLKIKRHDKGRDKSTYGPVPGGPRNCTRCRFFITGVPFLIPLWTHANVLSAICDQLALRIDAGQRTVERLKQERRELTSVGSPVPPELREAIMINEEVWLADIEARDQVLANFHSTMILTDKIRAIRAYLKSAKQQIDEKISIPILLADEEFPEMTGRESTRFELIDAVVQASRWFPSINADDLERERDEFLDKVLYGNGYQPIRLAPLTPEERRDSADAMAAFLLIKLGAEETQNVIEGRKSLSELGLDYPLEETYRRYVGKELPRSVLPTVRPPPRPPVLEGSLA